MKKLLIGLLVLGSFSSFSATFLDISSGTGFTFAVKAENLGQAKRYALEELKEIFSEPHHDNLKLYLTGCKRVFENETYKYECNAKQIWE